MEADSSACHALSSPFLAVKSSGAKPTEKTKRRAVERPNDTKLEAALGDRNNVIGSSDGHRDETRQPPIIGWSAGWDDFV